MRFREFAEQASGEGLMQAILNGKHDSVGPLTDWLEDNGFQACANYVRYAYLDKTLPVPYWGLVTKELENHGMNLANARVLEYKGNKYILRHHRVEQLDKRGMWKPAKLTAEIIPGLAVMMVLDLGGTKDLHYGFISKYLRELGDLRNQLYRYQRNGLVIPTTVLTRIFAILRNMLDLIEKLHFPRQQLGQSRDYVADMITTIMWIIVHEAAAHRIPEKDMAIYHKLLSLTDADSRNQRYYS